MHELGVVFHIIDDLEKVAADNAVTRINRVTLALGEVSTVIPHYLTDCWKWASEKNDLVRGAELVIEPIQAGSWCDDCKKQYGTVEHGRTCPYCGGGNTWLVQGNEFIIKEIEVPEEEDDGQSTGH